MQASLYARRLHIRTKTERLAHARGGASESTFGLGPLPGHPAHDGRCQEEVIQPHADLEEESDGVMVSRESVVEECVLLRGLL